MARKLNTFQFKNISYQFKPEYRGWLFVAPNYQLVEKCKGADIAHRVARLFHGGVERMTKTHAETLDGLTKFHIGRVVNS